MEQLFDKEQSQEKQARGFSPPEHLINKGIITGNASVIAAEIDWLSALLDNRRAQLRDSTVPHLYFSDFPPPGLKDKSTPYATMISEYGLGAAERLLLICSLLPHIAPDVFTSVLKDDEKELKLKYPKLGGYFDPVFRNFVPTLKTIVFLLAGDDMSGTLYNQLFLVEKSLLVKEQVISIDALSSTEDNTNILNHAIKLAPEFVNYLISGKKPRPDFGSAFPATLITTGLEWDQLVVKEPLRRELERIMRWEQQGKKLLEISGHKLSSSFTCLFYGPSGSGKTLAVQLLGKTLGIDVFRIDLSMIVSKYIGETEKNLAYLFDRARGKNWILFFDEADALFGKRTAINDAKDKWANLEMSYLLQRMEEHNGLTILASNLKNNIDTAMTRRFQSVIYFNRPEKAERIQLWQKLLPAAFSYHPQLNFDALGQYELTGGNIINVIKAACLEAVAANTMQINSQHLAEAINREFAKENRFL